MQPLRAGGQVPEADFLLSSSVFFLQVSNVKWIFFLLFVDFFRHIFLNILQDYFMKEKRSFLSL